MRKLNYLIKQTSTQPHHNTYDIEFWGPDGMLCTSFYLGALIAMTEMARYLRKNKEAAVYKKLYE